MKLCGNDNGTLAERQTDLNHWSLNCGSLIKNILKDAFAFA